MQKQGPDAQFEPCSFLFALVCLLPYPEAGREKGKESHNEDKPSNDSGSSTLRFKCTERPGWCTVEGNRCKTREEPRWRMCGTDNEQLRAGQLWHLAERELHAGIRFGHFIERQSSICKPCAKCQQQSGNTGFIKNASGNSWRSRRKDRARNRCGRAVSARIAYSVFAQRYRRTCRSGDGGTVEPWAFFFTASYAPSN